MPREKLSAVWPQCVPLLQPSLDVLGTHDAEDVRQAIEGRGATLWVQLDGTTVNACAVSEVIRFPKGLWCRVWLGGARPGFAHWRDLQSKIEQWCRSVGIKKIFVEGRAGWLRELVGARAAFAFQVKEL